MIPTASSLEGVTEITQPREQPSRTYAIDFEKGRIYGFVDGIAAVRQAIMKILQTERFAYLIYSWDYGVEMNSVLGKRYQTVESEIKRIVREAMLQDSRITEINDTAIQMSGKRSIKISITVQTIYGETSMEVENV